MSIRLELMQYICTQGVCLLPPCIGGDGTRVHRRIDIRLIPMDQYFFGVLYFTGKSKQYCFTFIIEKNFTIVHLLFL